MKRPDYTQVIQDLAFKNGKMAFVTGPRQVGKTTLAQAILKEHSPPTLYLNWDDPDFRRQWVRDPLKFFKQEVGKKGMAILDEVHKAPRWKNQLKGIYDTRADYWDILVTGSARLDVFRRGGESLLGRYFLFRLHPFSVGELRGGEHSLETLDQALTLSLKDHSDKVERLLHFSGFPEPYLKAEEPFLKVWRRNRVERLIREDLRDLTRAQDFAMIEALAGLLPERVGSTLSLASLREDLEVSHPTLKRWLGWLEQIYYLYQIRPYAKSIARSLKKETKPYLWDWSEVEDEAARFENLVASHFLKTCHYATDTGLGNFELFYLRDKEKREVDFLIVRDKKPWLLAECKWKDTQISGSLRYYAKQLNPKIVLQIVSTPGVHEKVSSHEERPIYLVSAGKIFELFF